MIRFVIMGFMVSCAVVMVLSLYRYVWRKFKEDLN